MKMSFGNNVSKGTQLDSPGTEWDSDLCDRTAGPQHLISESNSSGELIKWAFVSASDGEESLRRQMGEIEIMESHSIEYEVVELWETFIHI